MAIDPTKTLAETYVLDDDDLSELDETSLSGVMRVAIDTLEQKKLAPEAADAGSGNADEAAEGPEQDA